MLSRLYINLRNLAFYVWEDTSLWVHWIHFFHVQLSYLGPILFLQLPCFLHFPSSSAVTMESGSEAEIAKQCRTLRPWCKTQNSGLRSKEEKPRDPINQSSRCNTQEGLLSVAQTGWLWSPGRQSTPNSKLGKIFIGKKPYYQHITYGLQSDWLHVCKAILLVQTVRAFD